MEGLLQLFPASMFHTLHRDSYHHRHQHHRHHHHQHAADEGQQQLHALLTNVLGTVLGGTHGDTAAAFFAQHQQEEPKRPTADKVAVADLERVAIGSDSTCSG